MNTARILLAVAAPLACLAGCEEEPPAPAVDDTPREPEGPPPIPELSALVEPSRGMAQIVFPTWSPDDSRFDHPVRTMSAKRGSIEGVTQVLIGETAETGLMLTFYGASLTPDTYRILPATDETRAEHAGEDSRIFIAALGQEHGDLRSTEGSVVIERVTDDTVTGTVEATLRSRNNLRETVVRARFHAVDNQWLTAELEHQQAIRDQLRNR